MAFFNKKNKIKGEDISGIKLGTRIEISRLDSNGDFFHNSSLEEFISEDELLILVPISKGSLIKLSKDFEYIIVFKTPKGLYKNRMKILDYILKDEIPFLKIKLLDPTIKIQRRDCYRLNIGLEFKFDPVEENTEDILFCQDPLLSKGITEDLSNGGIKFLSNEELNVDDLIKCLLIFEDCFIVVIGRVLHIEKTINNPLKYSYKLRFERISQNDRELISKFIFNKQRQFLKNKDNDLN